MKKNKSLVVISTVLLGLTISLTACGSQSVNIETINGSQDKFSAPSTPSAPSTRVPEPVSTYIDPLMGLTFPDKTVKVGDSVTFTLTGIPDDKSVTLALSGDGSLIELDMGKGTGLKNEVPFIATKVGKSKIAVNGKDSNNQIVGKWNGFNLTVTE